MRKNAARYRVPIPPTFCPRLRSTVRAKVAVARTVDGSLVHFAQDVGFSTRQQLPPRPLAPTTVVPDDDLTHRVLYNPTSTRAKHSPACGSRSIPTRRRCRAQSRPGSRTARATAETGFSQRRLGAGAFVGCVPGSAGAGFAGATSDTVARTTPRHSPAE